MARKYDASGQLTPLQFDESGKPYYATEEGGRSYASPGEFVGEQGQTLGQTPNAQGVEWAKKNPGPGFGGFTGSSTFDPESGDWKRDNFFNSPLGGLILGGSVLALPEILTAAGIGAAPTAGAASSGAAGTVGATTATAGGKVGLLSSIGKYTDLATNLADVFGKASGASQGQNNTEDLLRTRLYGDEATAQGNAKKFALTAPGTRMSTALRAALAKAATPASLSFDASGIPQWSGGAKSIYPAMQDPQYQQLSQQVLNDEMLSQMRGGASGGNEDLSTPTPPEIGQTSSLDKILGGGALGSSILAAILKSRGGNVPKTPKIQDGV